MDAGGIQALRDRALSSTGDDGGETSREALAELAQTLTWLCRCSYYREDWYPNLEARERVGNARALGNGIIEIGQSGGSDGDRRRVGDESKRLYTPRNPTEEALLASLVFLEEERTIVAPKGRSNIGRSRTNLLPLLMWCGRSKAACEFLSVAENASGHYEGEETFKRWLLLTHACLAARLPGRAVRVSKSLIDSNFEVKDAGSDEDASGAEELGGGTHSAPSASVGPGASESRNGDGSEGTSRDLASSLFAPSSDAHKVHLLLMACRAKLDEHRLAMRSHIFDGGVGAAVATGWAEKALRLSSPDPDLSDLHESAVQAFAGCVLETLTRAHQGNPSCSPPRSTYDSALREAETHLTKIVSAKSNRSLSPITAYLLALVYVRRDKNKEALDLLTKVPNTNSGCQVFMSSLLAVLYGTEKRTSKGFNIVEKMLVNLEMQGMDPGNLEKQFFLHRVQLRFAIHKRGATGGIFQRGRHGDNEALIEVRSLLLAPFPPFSLSFLSAIVTPCLLACLLACLPAWSVAPPHASSSSGSISISSDLGVPPLSPLALSLPRPRRSLRTERRGSPACFPPTSPFTTPAGKSFRRPRNWRKRPSSSIQSAPWPTTAWASVTRASPR